MRFNKPVYFQKITSGEYNANTGNYDSDTIVERVRFADVTDTKTEIVQAMFGDVRKNILTIRLQTPYTEAFNRIRVADKIYKVEYSRALGFKQIFIVSEVQ